MANSLGFRRLKLRRPCASLLGPAISRQEPVWTRAWHCEISLQVVMETGQWWHNQ